MTESSKPESKKLAAVGTPVRHTYADPFSESGEVSRAGLVTGHTKHGRAIVGYFVDEGTASAEQLEPLK